MKPIPNIWILKSHECNWISNEWNLISQPFILSVSMLIYSCKSFNIIVPCRSDQLFTSIENEEQFAHLLQCSYCHHGAIDWCFRFGALRIFTLSQIPYLHIYQNIVRELLIGLIGFLVQKHAQCSETYEKQFSDFHFWEIINFQSNFLEHWPQYHHKWS